VFWLISFSVNIILKLALVFSLNDSLLDRESFRSNSLSPFSLEPSKFKDYHKEGNSFFKKRKKKEA